MDSREILEIIVSSGIPEKLKRLIAELEECLIEREEMIRLILLCIFSENHAFLIGEAGVAKTYALKLISRSVEDAVYWEQILSEETSEEQIMGDGGRNIPIEDTIANGDFVLLDEMFKAKQTLLNSLLTILNERVIYINGKATPIPLSTMFSASNELPSGKTIEPFVDRLLMWYEVKKIAKFENQLMYNKGALKKPSELKNKFKKADIKFVSQLSDEIELSDEHALLLTRIKRGMGRIGLKCSDRKFGRKFVTKALITSAILNSRAEVNYSDFVLIRHFGWSSLGDRSLLLALLNNVIYGDKVYIKTKLLELQKIVKKITSSFESEMFLFLRNREEIASGAMFDEKIGKCKLFLEALEVQNNNFMSFRRMEKHAEQIDREVEENIFIVDNLINPFLDKEIQELMDNIESMIIFDKNRVGSFLEKNSSMFEYQNTKLRIERGE